MLLRSLALRNIRSYEHETVSLPAGTVLLSGDVGCGKSSLLLAIEFALFGLQKGELSGSDMLRHGAPYGFAELSFDLDGKAVRVKRALRRTATGIVQDPGMLTIDGVTEELAPTELKARMLQLFGYPADALKKNIPLFRYTVFTPQEEMKRILWHEDSRLDVLRKVFGIDKYRIIRENARLLLAGIRAEKKEREAFAADYQLLCDEEAAKKRLLGAQEQECSRLEKEIAFLEQDIHERRNSMASLKEAIAAANRCRQQKVQKETELRARVSRVARIDRDVALLDARIGAAERELGKAVRSAPLRSEQEIASALAGLDQERDMLIHERAVSREEAKRHERVLIEGTCSVCGQDVRDREHFARAIGIKKEAVAQIERQLAAIEQRIAGMKEEREAARAFLFENEKRSHQGQLLADARGQRSALVQEKASAEQEMAELEKDIAGLVVDDDAEARYAALDKALHGVMLERLERERALSRAAQKCDDLRQSLAQLAGTIAEKQRMRESIRRLADAATWIDAYLIAVMDVMEKHVMAAIQKEFNGFFRSWFSLLMDEGLDVRIDEAFSPVIEQNGFETEYSNLSGGEKTAVALAYRLALNKVINRLIDSVKTKDFLILDEPTDGFSAEQLDKLRNVIRELGLGQILIVSHEQKVDTFVDTVLRVYKDQHISRVAA